MITDIFAYRYKNTLIWKSFGEAERSFLVQGYRLVVEQLFPYWLDGKEDSRSKAKLAAIHDKLSMELGLHELSPKYYSYQTTWNGKPHTASGFYTLDQICKVFVCSEYIKTIPADRFMKERLSFIEIAFQLYEEEIKAINIEFPDKFLEAQAYDRIPSRSVLRVPGSKADGVKVMNELLNTKLSDNVKELNERLRRAGFGLHYHNGLIQLSTDEKTLVNLEEPFWAILSGKLWKNVDIDIKESIDRRDSGIKDAAFYSARALESTIKIISDQRGWTRGNEKGASNYIDNLCNPQNENMIQEWEKRSLKEYFSSVRNPIGHGAGSAEIRELSQQQTTWAIEISMSWIKNLISRI